jgi:hypothetical protein
MPKQTQNQSLELTRTMRDQNVTLSIPVSATNSSISYGPCAVTRNGLLGYGRTVTPWPVDPPKLLFTLTLEGLVATNT